MNYKPTHNVIDPFPEFSTEEIQYYIKRGRLLSAVALPEIMKSISQLFGDWWRNSFHRAMPERTR